MKKEIFKDLSKATLIILMYIVSLGFGTLLTILLVSVDLIANTPYEQIIIFIHIFYLLLLWLSLMIILKNSILFIMFNTPLYFALFFQTNSYYPYVTLLFMITLTLSILLRNIGGEFAFLPRLKTWVSSKQFL